MTGSEETVYHLVLKQLEGDTLYPLNVLKQVAPDVAAGYLAKYQGREQILERKIPVLNCLWNDVLMFSPVHPAVIMDAFHENGWDIGPYRWFEIPLKYLESTNVAVYFPRMRQYGDLSAAHDDFALLRDVEFSELTTEVTRLEQHIRMANDDGRRPMMFAGIPHILYKGNLSLKELSVIEA